MKPRNGNFWSAVSIPEQLSWKDPSGHFGWAVLALFGTVKESEKTMLSGVVALAAAWPVLLLGIAFPKIALFFLALVPLPKWVPSIALRIIWIALGCIAPLVVAAVIAKRTPATSAPTSFAARFLSGIRATVALSVTFFIEFVGAPIEKIISVAKRRGEVHIPVLISKESYRETAEDVRGALNRHRIMVAPAKSPWLDKTVTNLLKSIGGPILKESLPEHPQFFRSKELDVSVTMNGVTLRGTEPTLLHAHSFVAEAMTFSPALQALAPEAQKLERELKDIWEVYRSEPEAHSGSSVLLGRVHEVAEELRQSELSFDDWQLSYRELLQLERAIEGKPLLLSNTDQSEQIMESTHTHTNGAFHQDGLSELSFKDLLGRIVPDFKSLLEKEVALAKAELQANIRSELSMVKQLAVTGVLALFAIMMLFVSAAMALHAWVAEWVGGLIVAGVLFLAAGIVGAIGWSHRVKKPLETTQQTIKEDVEWLKNRMA